MDATTYFSLSVYTVVLQWLEHLWDHENMFQTGVVRATVNHSALSGGKIGGDSNEYTQYTIFAI